MNWTQMTLDEYADLEKSNGARVYKIDDVWWQEVRPFFYRPLFPFATIEPGLAKLPLRVFLGGYKHPTSVSELSNSYLNFVVFDEVSAYSIGKLKSDHRNLVRKGQKFFQIRPIEDFQEFILSGYRVYKSFYERTGYAWRNDRQRHRGFERWARNLFSFKKVLVLGAYHQEMLCAVAITYWVANLILFATYFSDTKSLKLGVSDFMWHHVREMASQCNGVTHIYSGVFVGPKSTDEFKLRRGAKIITIPAYYRINAISLSLIKLCEKEKYEQLIGYDEGEVDIMLELLLHRDKQQRFV